MKNSYLIVIILFNCIALSNYYDIDIKYTVEDASCIPKSQLTVENKQDKIETYLNTNKKPLRKKPTYEKIN